MKKYTRLSFNSLLPKWCPSCKLCLEYYFFTVAAWHKDLLAYLLLDLAAPDLIPSIPEFFTGETIVNVVEVNQQHCIDESGQLLENVA